MEFTVIPLTLLYTTIIISLIWARFRFFKVTSNTKRLYVYLYDPAAGIQIAATYYFLFSGIFPLGKVEVVLGSITYILSLLLFWWSIHSVKQLEFAFSGNIEKLLSDGPYAIFRHPFYISYALTWGCSTILFNSFILWITLCYLMAYYYIAAKSEEEAILAGEHSQEYRLYSQNVGMFLPRIKKWKG